MEPGNPMHRAATLSFVTLAALLVGGCPPEHYDTFVGPSLIVVDRIRDDSSLTSAEQREQLEALGISPLTVNALMWDDPFANQFGGDIRSAYDKVTEPDFQKLTPDEVQFYSLHAKDVQPDLDFAPNDEEAYEIVRFFYQRDIRTPEELAAYLDASGSVPADIPDGILRALFVDFDTDLLIPNLP